MATAPLSPVGIILPSRPVLTTPLPISPTQFAFTIAPFPTFSHIVVFLLPGTTLPPSTLAAVYIQLPSSGSPAFQLLGALGNEKQSAIFKILPPQPSSEPLPTISWGSVVVGEEDVMVDEVPAAAAGNGITTQSDITVGISIEDAITVTAQLSALSSTQTLQTKSPSSALTLSHLAASPTSAIPTKILAQRIIKNAFNFLASFAGTVGAGGEEVVPLRSFRDWWVKFERRIENEPGFLERDGDG